VSPSIPQSWLICEIGEVAQVLSGGTPPSKDPANFATDRGVPWITPADLSGYGEIYIARGSRDLSRKGYAACSATMIPAGSVLFSSRAPVGYVAIASNDVTTNQGFKSFVLPDGLDNRYVYFYLRHIKPIAENMATGTTFKELSGSAAARLPLILAPTEEQKRIAEKLDALLARVGACRERLNRVMLIIKRFREAVLAGAVSGELTEAFTFGNMNWSTRPLGQLLKDIRYGTAKKSTYDKNVGLPVIRIPNIVDRRVDPTDLKYGHLDEQEIETLSLRDGDVLVIRSNGSLDLVGRAAVVGPEVQGYLFAGYLIRLRADTSLIDPRYLCIYLSSPQVRRYIEQTARSTSGVNNINSGELRAIVVRLPDLQEQYEIVRRTDALFSFVDRLELRAKSALTQVERLTPTLLAKAFSGELVPQDPNDEPASALLERIRNQRVYKTAKEKEKGSKVTIRKTKKWDVLSVLREANRAMSTEELFVKSGFDEESVDEFYEQVRKAWNSGEIQEQHEGILVRLEAVKR